MQQKQTKYEKLKANEMNLIFLVQNTFIDLNYSITILYCSIFMGLCRKGQNLFYYESLL